MATKIKDILDGQNDYLDAINMANYGFDFSLVKVSLDSISDIKDRCLTLLNHIDKENLVYHALEILLGDLYRLKELNEYDLDRIISKINYYYKKFDDELIKKIFGDLREFKFINISHVTFLLNNLLDELADFHLDMEKLVNKYDLVLKNRPDYESIVKKLEQSLNIEERHITIKWYGTLHQLRLLIRAWQENKILEEFKNPDDPREMEGYLASFNIAGESYTKLKQVPIKVKKFKTRLYYSLDYLIDKKIISGRRIEEKINKIFVDKDGNPCTNYSVQLSQFTKETADKKKRELEEIIDKIISHK